MAKLKDVARLAEVSISTVSRVINEPELVRESTRKRVQDAIESLRYQPSRVARRLRVESGWANLVGLIIPDIQNPFFADVARGVEDVAQHHGYTVFLGNSDEDALKEARYLDVMVAEAVDGIIVPPIADNDPAVAELARTGLPMVCVDRRLARVTVDTIVVDNVRGAYEAIDHLIRLGHQRIGFIEGRPELSTSKERLQGYRQALDEHGIALDPSLMRAGDSRQPSGRRLTLELLELAEAPTALLVGNNLMTLGALEAINAQGVRIPDDLALISYDDMPWAMAFNPPLTAVRQPGYEVGHRAMELLLRRFREPARSTTLLTLQPELVVRKSCGAGLPNKRLRRSPVAAAPSSRA